MTETKDFNHLKEWLTRKLEERRINIEELAKRAGISRTVVYYWINDVARPSTRNLLKVVHYLSTVPVWKQRGTKGDFYQEIEEVTFEEAVKQFSEKKVGRPKGSGSGTKSVSVRGR